MNEEKQEQVSKKPDFNDILASVNELNKQQIQEIHIPSLNDTVAFKPLTVKQQKQLLSSGVDIELENLTFSNTINDIITENCLSRKDEIKLTDRSLIVYQLRVKAVGPILKFTDDEIQYEIDLDKQLKSITKLDNTPPTKFSVKKDELIINGEVPGLVRDTLYNKQFTTTMKTRRTSEGVKLTDIVGDIYIHEMVKYVTSIDIGGNKMDLDGSLTVPQAIQIFESLPMSVSSDVAEKIKECRDLELKVMNPEDLPEDVQLPFDASLFTSE